MADRSLTIGTESASGTDINVFDQRFRKVDKALACHLTIQIKYRITGAIPGVGKVMDAVDLPIFGHSAQKERLFGHVVSYIDAKTVVAVLVDKHGQIFGNGTEEHVNFFALVFPVHVFDRHFDRTAFERKVGNAVVAHTSAVGTDLQTVIGGRQDVKVKTHLAICRNQFSFSFAFGKQGFDGFLTLGVVYNKCAGGNDIFVLGSSGEIDERCCCKQQR